MTTRVSGFVVTLEKDMREDDAKELARSIELLRGVVSVDYVGSDPLVMQTAQHRLQQKMVEAVYAAFKEKP